MAKRKVEKAVARSVGETRVSGVFEPVSDACPQSLIVVSDLRQSPDSDPSTPPQAFFARSNATNIRVGCNRDTAVFIRKTETF